ncbi:MAG: pantoate--beta-alanine ligase [Bacteroidia bacterium]
MLVLKKASALKSYIYQNKPKYSIGFVPTMGALHLGHISLINQAKINCDIVVCSIFVNPTQFNNKNDFDNYPQTIENDLKLLAKAGCDVVFVPDFNEIYNAANSPHINLDKFGKIINVFEGELRPGHFNGVIDVVTRLFLLVEPNQVFFGQKDYQQCLVVKKLIEINNFDIKFNMCPSVREEDGLAMSSRNIRLSSDERKMATIPYKMLKFISQNWPNKPELLIKQAIDKFNSENVIKIEYLSICNANDLSFADINTTKPLILFAGVLGSTRLIDNMLVEN